MSKTIEDLRDHLFAAMAGIKDGSVTIEQAKTIGDIAQVVVNSAKVEVDFARVTDRHDSAFLAVTSDIAPRTLPNGILGVRRHLLKDD